MLSDSDYGPPPPGVMVAARKMLEDTAYEPQYAERVPYLIARGAPGSRVVDRAIDPLDFLNNGYFSSLSTISNLRLTVTIFQISSAGCQLLHHTRPHSATGKDLQPHGRRCKAMVSGDA